MLSDDYLSRRPANHQPLTPLDLLDRTVEVFPDRTAVIWGGESWTYADLAAMVNRFAAALTQEGIGRGDVVSIMAANRPEMLAAHFAVPMVGAILNTINTRLDPGAVAAILDHARPGLVLADPNNAETARVAAGMRPFRMLGTSDLDLLSEIPAPEPVDWRANVTDEWQPICLNYTSGTTGRPKGVVYHHRGAYLNAIGNLVSLGFDRQTVYLWTLPMFHCNGWCHTWAVTAAGGIHVCLDGVDPGQIFAEIERRGVTHMSAAPVVLYMMLAAPERGRRQRDAARVLVATGGAAPTTGLIEQLDEIAFDLVHLYGLTETYGPATMMRLEVEHACLPASDRAALQSRQGLRHITAGRATVVRPDGDPVRPDAAEIGEIVLSGNTVMAGYKDDSEATEESFLGGRLRTGDLGVLHPDGAIEIRDRAKDIIITGGENVSSLEVENVLYGHPEILFAAVVAAPDPKWGETPYAFVERKPGSELTADDVLQFCRQRLAGFKRPRRVVFGAIPKTATGKIQKFILREEARRLASESP